MSNKTLKMPKRNRYREFVFHEYPDFRPNMSPSEIMRMGSFGGTYWRPIKSSVTNESYSNQHKKYPEAWWKDIPNGYMTRKWEDYNKTINKYGVNVGTTLEFWEDKDWITGQNPYGWFQWYCDFFMGRRGLDDTRQANRWIKTAGPKSRFRRALINEINRKNTEYDDFTISPKRRQTLQHWAYILTKRDCR